MKRFRGLTCSFALAAAMVMAGTATAGAATFYVNERGTSVTCSGPGINACPTIKEAVARAEKVASPNTIEVEPETGGTTYHESIELLNSKAAGLTINGSEPGVVVVGKKGPALDIHAVGAVTVSNLKLKASNEPALLKSAIVTNLDALTLDNVAVENESGEGVNGIEARETGSVTMNGGTVEMENGSAGFAVYAFGTPLVLNGVKILNGAASEADAGGIYSEKSTLSVTNSQIDVESGMSTVDFDISAGTDSAVSITNVTARQNSPSLGVIFEASPAIVNGLRVEMVDTNGKLAAVLSEEEGASASFSHLEVGGTWVGSGLQAVGGDITLSDSRVIASPASAFSALRYIGAGSSRGLLVQRSVLQTGASAAPGALSVTNGNATVDSSEILGGVNGVRAEATSGPARVVTLAGSAIDAGAGGIAADAAGVNGVEAVATSGSGSQVSVAVEGSILLEKQAASAAAGDTAGVSCTYTAAPSQAQAAGGGAGAISCASGLSGNAEVNPLVAVFSEPLSAYQLLPSSSAVDSVPAGAVALPSGITPSATDLAGNPRIVDGNGDCIALQDKGALELQGHSAVCLGPPPAKPPTSLRSYVIPPVAARITSLSLSPSAFFAAPHGASISKRTYGTRITYRDSQVASTTFTVLRPHQGRTQGRSCKKPSRGNRHGRRCTYYTPLGSFSHVDRAATNSLHFSGRLHGRKLAPGSYRLQAVARDAAGNGAPVNRSFSIR